MNIKTKGIRVVCNFLSILFTDRQTGRQIDRRHTFYIATKTFKIKKKNRRRKIKMKRMT